MNLEQRVQRLEDIDAIKRVMSAAGRWFDRCETTADSDDIARFYDSLFAEGGYMEFPFGKWGPNREEIIQKLSSFAQTIDWSLHHYTNIEVELNEELSKAIYHAIEIIPILITGTATWMFVENESELHKVGGVWKIYKYGIIDFKSVNNSDKQWPKFDNNPKSWMFTKCEWQNDF